MEKLNLIGLNPNQLEQEIAKISSAPKKAKMITKQLWQWLYAKGVADFALMSNISKEMRHNLSEQYAAKRPAINQDLLSTDGTRKWLLKFSDCREAEMVFIPEDDRGTLCISSQIGCTLTCKFCHTGTQMLVRNLTAGEIVGQLMLAKDLLQDWPNQNITAKNQPPQKPKITSVVFMGMGEPFFNYENVKKAVEILNDDNGINLSKRKITISTSGLVPEIEKFADEIKTTLAISLHATDDETRTKIMPINKKYPLADLMTACKKHCQQNNARITFEYVMLKGVNDSDEQAQNLIKLLKKYQISALINLIPFNPWQGSDFECSSRNRIMAFGKIIKNAGYTVTIRKTRGQDVMAACGQLKSASERVKKKLG
jgi:23S rRNA (adenine2503-C2)-methyltransferase